eukprot:EG_transcript_38655
MSKFMAFLYNSCRFGDSESLFTIFVGIVAILGQFEVISKYFRLFWLFWGLFVVILSSLDTDAGVDAEDAYTGQDAEDVGIGVDGVYAGAGVDADTGVDARTG